MSGDSERVEGAEPGPLLAAVLAVLGGISLTLVLLTAPADQLLGASAVAIRGAVHGSAALLLMLTATIGLYQGYRIFLGQAWSLAELQIGSVLNAGAAFMTVLSGNWIYIPYRAAGGPRAYFMAQSPEIHRVFFEFKEFAALFTIPLSVTAAYLLVRHGHTLYRRRGLSSAIAALLLLNFFYFFMAFALGAAITKLRSV